MKAAGYQYVCIDDHWHGGRDSNKNLYPDPKKFPNGIKPLADYVHSKGLKLGTYSDAGTMTRGKEPGSVGFEEIDARTFASWEEDQEIAIQRYTAMGRAPAATAKWADLGLTRDSLSPRPNSGTGYEIPKYRPAARRKDHLYATR